MRGNRQRLRDHTNVGAKPRAIRHLLTTAFAALALIIVALALIGCGSKQLAVETTTGATGATTLVTTPSTASTVTTTPAAGATTTTGDGPGKASGGTFSIYLAQGEKMAPTLRADESGAEATTAARAAGAVTALLQGPTDVEKSAPEVSRLNTAIPAGTKLLGLTIAGDTATVDLTSTFGSGGGSLSMFLRIGQVVYTVTQFTGVQKVLFHLDGKPVEALGGEGIMLADPVTRADSENVTPAILVESPASGGTLVNPATLRGTANVFEAVFWVELQAADGTVLAKHQITASSGSGTRGTFGLMLPYPITAGPGRVVAYTLSAKDGSKTDMVVVPVTLVK
jgi:spore germination protein GerM